MSAQLVKELFADALELPPSARPAFLVSACSGDVTLMEELSRLLDAHEKMGDFFGGAQTGSIASGALLCERYRVIRYLGGGGMGEVYEVFDQELSASIAIKTLRASPGIHDQDHRFRRELQLARQITHPNVCRVFDYHRHEDSAGTIEFISMQHLAGETLAARLQRGPIPEREGLAIACQICDGIASAHQLGIIHRDLKSANIMLLPPESSGIKVSIMDFGMAREIEPPNDSSGFHTGVGQIIGTPAYIAPEQLQGGSITAATDIYSLGVVLYEMFTGRRPFEADTPWGAACKRLTETPEPPRRRNAALSQGINAAVMKCLEREPARRYQSAGELKRALMLKPGWRAVAMVAAAAALAAILGLTGTVGRVAQRFAPIPPEKHIAVLPFTGASGDGLSAAIATRLGRLRAFQKSYWVVPYADIRVQGVHDPTKARTVFGANLAVTGEVAADCEIRVIDTATARVLRSRRVALAADIPAIAATMLELAVPPEADRVADIAGYTAPGAYQFYQQGNSYLERYGVENADQAIQLFDKALTLDPKYTAASAGLAQALAKKYGLTKDKQWADRAEEAAARALALDPNLAAVRAALGFVKLSTGKYAAAIPELEKARDLDPTNGETLSRLGRAYDGAGDQLQAEAVLQAAVTVQQNYWGAYNDLGEFYSRHSQYAKAEPLFRIVTELAPDNPLGFANLGGLYVAEAKYAEARQALERALKLKPMAAVYTNLGTALYDDGRYREATEAFRKSTELAPGDYRLWRNLGDALERANRPAEARAAFAKCATASRAQLRSAARDARTLSGESLCEAKIGQAAAAKKAIQEALLFTPQDSSVLYRAAVVYVRVGDIARALDNLESAIAAGYPRTEILNTPELAPLLKNARISKWTNTNPRR